MIIVSIPPLAEPRGPNDHREDALHCILYSPSSNRRDICIQASGNNKLNILEHHLVIGPLIFRHQWRPRPRPVEFFGQYVECHLKLLQLKSHLFHFRPHCPFRISRNYFFRSFWNIGTFCFSKRQLSTKGPGS